MTDWQTALERLLEGNRRFSEGRTIHKDYCAEKKKSLLHGQKPFATVVACSDSRVAPDLLFDCGPGEIFGIRTAGNVIDPVVLGTIEFGALYLQTPLLLIIGHESCGAVSAAFDLACPAEGSIGAVLDKIKPAVDKVKASGAMERAEGISAAIVENIKNVRLELLNKSAVLARLCAEGKLRVIPAKYYMSSCQVMVLE